MDLNALQLSLRHFARERDWEQFHTPKNLAMAVTVEASELLEIFQWLDPKQSQNLSDDQKAAVEQELADIQIYLARLADVVGVDIESAVEEKLKINAEKYPADRVRGSAKKYTEYDPDNG